MDRRDRSIRRRRRFAQMYKHHMDQRHVLMNRRCSPGQLKWLKSPRMRIFRAFYQSYCLLNGDIWVARFLNVRVARFGDVLIARLYIGLQWLCVWW